MIKVMKQALLVMLLLYVGNVVSSLISPLVRLPGNLLGMLILFLLLATKTLKLTDIESLANLLLGIMGFFFIPLGVSLINSAELLKPVWFQLSMVLVLSCVLVMYVSSKVTDVLIKRTSKKEVG
ncbi:MULTISPECIES: CidA/LrgA family protein [unclassified Fusibacter]|uniref:CidA/LrgA family protein n=1 Tax=unclassified Fusibacter TaxID=2624464 RepID=UPI001011A6D4|nr:MULTISPECIES: CidA/LrgA family protein [unclassified Fusibacter]MCK8058679.1 CidA/LrgA family protein [Fusibacter sp. A2]NPE21754.1 CidA/LrgA family protein [Fusibacter sp. A1]RXV61328.1 CidA/LrgA family protein [Fusibacter sp. A1]